MRWSYKTVHFSLKKEGLLGSAFLDENELEISLNEYGRLGWELVSLQEVNDGLIAIFKQPFTKGMVSFEEDSIAAESALIPLQQQVDDSPVISLPKEVVIERELRGDNAARSEIDVGSIRIM